MAVSRREDEKMRELTSVTAIKEDAEMLLGPYLSFEKFLTPAPMVISILGMLRDTKEIFTLFASVENFFVVKCTVFWFSVLQNIIR